MKKGDCRSWFSIIFIVCVLLLISNPTIAKQSLLVSDFDTPQAAIDAASSGDTIIFDDIFDISKPIIVEKQLHLIGLGWGTGINNYGTGSAVLLNYRKNARGEVAQNDFINGIKISNLQIVGNDHSEYGIYAYKCNFLEISGCNIRNNAGGNIVLDGTQDNCRIVNNNIDTLDYFFGELRKSDWNTYLTKGNYGIRLKGSIHDCLIEGNHIEGNKYGIYSDDAGTLLVNLVITGNDIDDSRIAGIHLEGPTDFIITSNVLGNSNSPADFCATIRIIYSPPVEMNGIIQGNSIRTTSTVGILGSDLENVLIIGNEFIGVGKNSIKLDGDSESIIIANNIVKRPKWWKENSQGGIFAESLNNSNINSNVLNNCTDEGIRIDGGASNSIQSNVIIDPDQHLNGVPGVLNKSDNSLISQNIIRDGKSARSMTYGIRNYSSTTKVLTNSVDGAQLADTYPLQSVDYGKGATINLNNQFGTNNMEIGVSSSYPYLKSSSNIELYPTGIRKNPLMFFSDGDSFMRGFAVRNNWQIRSNTNMKQTIFAIDETAGNQLVITNHSNRNRDHFHDAAMNPSLFVHSNTDVSKDNSQYVEINHNGNDGKISTGTGVLLLETESGGEGTVASVISRNESGDPETGHDGLMCVNTLDKTLKVYADGGWRIITSW